MIRIPVISSNLASVGYDIVSSTLEVQFHSGDIYDYSGVSALIYQGLIDAPSKGHYLDAVVKKGGYPYVKVYDSQTLVGNPNGSIALTSPLVAGVTLLEQAISPSAPAAPATSGLATTSNLAQPIPPPTI